MVYEIVKWYFPRTYAQIKQEVTEFYEGLGVHLRYTPLGWHISPVQEGCPEIESKMQIEAFIDKGMKVHE